MRQFRRRHDGRIGDLHAMVQLVAFLQAAQDGDGGLHVGLVHQHLLEAPFQRGVLLDVLVVFVQRGRAHAMQFAARQRGLEHVAGVHGALGLAGAHHGVQLVDEDDGLARMLGQFLQHGLEAFLELAPVLGTGQQPGQVQRQDALALEGFRHLAVDDALGQALDDRGLAHAGFADQHRVVLGAPLQDLDGAADLVVAPDHRVELALAGTGGQVQGVFLQCLAVVLVLGTRHGRAAAHRLDGGFQRLALQPGFAQGASDLALVVDQRQQVKFAGDVGVAALAGFLVGARQSGLQVAADLDVALGALDRRQCLDLAIQLGLQARHRHARARQQAGRAAVRVAQQGRQQMGILDIGIVVAHRQALGVGERLLELRRQFIESHEWSPL